jgi:ABC-type transport system involved in multi-copper enzyme maturation permease subunit
VGAAATERGVRTLNAFRLSPAVIVVVVRTTLLDFANRRYLWWLFGIATMAVVGLAIVGRWVPLAGYTTHEKALLFHVGMGELFVNVAIIVIGLAIIRPEIDSGAAALALTRPVSHAEYVVGRYLGSAVMLVGSLAIMGVGSVLVVAAADSTVDLTLLHGFAALAASGSVILAVMTLLAIVAGTIASAVLGFVIFRVAIQGPTILALIRDGVVTGPAATLLRAFTLVLPHMVPSPIMAGRETPITTDVSYIVLGPQWYDWIWALAWIVGCLAFAVVEMRRREL